MSISTYKVNIPEFSGVGRLFEGERKVRLGDVDINGRLRLDALLRYAQDFSTDDTDDSGVAGDVSWVVRSVQLQVHKVASLGEQLSMATACSGLGKMWAQRRIEVRGNSGAHYDLVVLWICLDAETRRPVKLTNRFVSIYGAAANGNVASAKRMLSWSNDNLGKDIVWPLRRSDFDVYKHMNNAAYGSVLEEVAGELLDGPSTVIIEYLDGFAPTENIGISVQREQNLRLIRFSDVEKPAALALIQAK